MENEGPLLSICIPTYNRKGKLQIAVEAFIEAIKGYEEIVELIVSDNGSNDGSYEFLQSHYSNLAFLQCYKNDSNLGFNRNMFLLVDKYASGKYCWVIGDDDYVDKDAVGIIINALNSNSQIKYLSVNYRLLDSYDDWNRRKEMECVSRECRLEFDRFAVCMDNNASGGNILCTFMSSSIFYRASFAAYSKELFSDYSWSNYYDCFPNAYLMATLFHNEFSAYIKEPLITIIPDNKTWDDKLYIICISYLPDMFCYFLTLGIRRKDMKKNIKILRTILLRYLLKSLCKGEKKIGKEFISFFKLIFYKIC